MTATPPGPAPVSPARGWIPVIEAGFRGYAEPGGAPRVDQPQRVACYRCVAEGSDTPVPQVYVLVGGYSYCLDHVRVGEQARAAAAAQAQENPWQT